jgi:hypothetical protein
MGSSALKNNQTMIITVVSQNRYEKKMIADILASQKHKTLTLYDIDVVHRENAAPLDFEGAVNPQGMSYDEITAESRYFWAKAFIEDAYVNEIDTQSPDLHMAKVVFNIEVIR